MHVLVDVLWRNAFVGESLAPENKKDKATFAALQQTRQAWPDRGQRGIQGHLEEHEMKSGGPISEVLCKDGLGLP